jgi:hypothetical protein
MLEVETVLRYSIEETEEKRERENSNKCFLLHAQCFSLLEVAYALPPLFLRKEKKRKVKQNSMPVV